MDYNHVKSFLENFKKLLSQKESSYGIIAETITKHISSPIDTKMIKVKGNTIYIQGSPMLRGEVLIHKQGILSDLNKFTPQSHFKDIR